MVRALSSDRFWSVSKNICLVGGFSVKRRAKLFDTIVNPSEI